LVTSQGENRGNGKNKGYIFLRVMGESLRKETAFNRLYGKETALRNSVRDRCHIDRFFHKGPYGISPDN